MTRTIVVRFTSAFDPQPTNVNDEIGLDAHQSYTKAQYLEDLAGDGKEFVSAMGVRHFFKDGTVQYLAECQQKIDESKVDTETLALLYGVHDSQVAIA